MPISGSDNLKADLSVMPASVTQKPRYACSAWLRREHETLCNIFYLIRMREHQLDASTWERYHSLIFSCLLNSHNCKEIFEKGFTLLLASPLSGYSGHLFLFARFLFCWFYPLLVLSSVGFILCWFYPDGYLHHLVSPPGFSCAMLFCYSSAWCL